MSHNHLFRLFVYGTAVSIEPARVRGRLYELLYGIPVLEVPECDIIAQSTANLLGDLAQQHYLEVNLSGYPECDSGNWQQIEGELISLSEPDITVPPIDRLEGFCPDGTYLYQRVLVPVKLSDGCVTTAWCYVSSSRRLQSVHATDETTWP